MCFKGQLDIPSFRTQICDKAVQVLGVSLWNIFKKNLCNGIILKIVFKRLLSKNYLFLINYYEYWLKINSLLPLLGWSYLSNPKLQRWDLWCLGMAKFMPICTFSFHISIYMSSFMLSIINCQSVLHFVSDLHICKFYLTTSLYILDSWCRLICIIYA